MKASEELRLLGQGPWESITPKVELLEARVAELEHDYAVMTGARDELLETINALNEENSQLAHRLWCLENPA
ncbi:MAG: hypothetical protein LUO93_09540 [Methanomicrobiales archaeon]|nr:hypothetical protein [Methanomicrobiales archaeon]